MVHRYYTNSGRPLTPFHVHNVFIQGACSPIYLVLLLAHNTCVWQKPFCSLSLSRFARPSTDFDMPSEMRARCPHYRASCRSSLFRGHHLTRVWHSILAPIHASHTTFFWKRAQKFCLCRLTGSCYHFDYAFKHPTPLPPLEKCIHLCERRSRRPTTHTSSPFSC